MISYIHFWNLLYLCVYSQALYLSLEEDAFNLLLHCIYQYPFDSAFICRGSVCAVQSQKLVDMKPLLVARCANCIS